MLNHSSTGLIVLFAAFLIATGGALAQDELKYPDWSGQWRKARNSDGSVTPKYDPSKPDGRGQEAPLKEKYRLIHEESLADQATGGQGAYLSSVRCIPSGMPFIMSIVFPFEFVVTPKTTYILYEIMTSQPRRIYTDGRDWPKNEEPTFNGTSIGKWIDTDGDGRFDTLEVETRNMKVPRIYDQTGIPFHEDGQGVIKERIYLAKDRPNIIHNEMTTTDNALTRPWTVMKTFVREPKVVWAENNCTEGNYDVVIGKEHYLLSGDGHLMPIQKGQKPPDLRYFVQPPK